MGAPSPPPGRVVASLLVLLLLLGRAGGGLSGRLVDDSRALQREAERLAGLGLLRDFYDAVALAGILHRLEAGADSRP